MTITIDNNDYEFSMSSDGQSWTGEVSINDEKIEIEIDKTIYLQKNIEWNCVKDFIQFISKDDIVSNLINESIQPLKTLANAFWRKSKSEISDYEMTFTGIYFRGILDSQNANLYSYCLIFNFLTIKDNEIFGDEYGLYLADIEQLNIVGARRIQL